MKRNLFIVICMILAFVLQSTAGKWFSSGFVTPNLILIMVSVFGFMCGSACGLLTGFFTGLMWDLFYGDVLGFYAMLFMYIGFLNGGFKQIFFKEDIKLPIVLVSCSDLIYGIICYLARFLLRGRFQFGTYFTHIILPEAVYTVLLTLVIYPLISMAVSRLEEQVERGKGEESYVKDN
ncbi:MAG: rod shape-determining protein MreD [Lachnospiraceae bacterium]|nr:rod shape-determining protein MreD [Lachnospiraceae bacterium]